jgi:hypothetical protein
MIVVIMAKGLSEVKLHTGGGGRGHTPLKMFAEPLQEAEAADLDLMDQVAKLLANKTKALGELRDMNNEAHRKRQRGDCNSFEETFQNEYAMKVLEVRLSVHLPARRVPALTFSLAMSFPRTACFQRGKRAQRG